MNRYRMRHPDHGKPAKKAPDNTNFGSMTDDEEVSDAADGVYEEALKHRAGVIARDVAAKPRKKKVGARRG